MASLTLYLPLLVFCGCDKYLRKQLKRRKDLFWLMVSEGSVHGWLAPLLWASHETEHHGTKSMCWSKVAHLMVDRKQRERERERERDRKWSVTSDKYIFSGHTSNSISPKFYYIMNL
jgi:hypothetical protein